MINEPGPDEPSGQQLLARFLQDWTALWRAELQARASDPEAALPGMLAGLFDGGKAPETATVMELLRATTNAWAETFGALQPSMVRQRDRAAAPRTQAAPAASDARDAEIERLARRVDELEARLAKLEAPRRRRG